MIGKRTIFDEIMEGLHSMKKHREGKITLRTYKVEPPQLPEVDSRGTRKKRASLRSSHRKCTR